MKKTIMTIIPWGLVGILLTLLFTLKACPGNATEIQDALKKELEPLKADIAASGKKVETLLVGQKNQETTNKKLIQELAGVEKTAMELKKQLATRPAPDNPNDFKSLPECQAKYTTLKESFELCLDLEKSRVEQHNLFSQVYDNLMSQKELLNKAIAELTDQVKGYAGIEKSITTSLEKLDRAYKAGRFWRDAKYLTIGVGVGLGAAVLTTTVIVILKAIKK